VRQDRSQSGLKVATRTHLTDDETLAKTGHPVVGWSDVGHASRVSYDFVYYWFVTLAYSIFVYRAKVINFIVRRPLSFFCLLLTIFTLACAQQVVAPPPTPPPPLSVITKVTAAKKIFVSNAGADNSFLHFIPGGPNGTYSELYASLKQWGYFQLVDSPSQADLIFEIRSSTIINQYVKPGGNVNIASDTIEGFIPIFTLSIFDASTHDPVDSIVMPAGRGSNKAKGAIAFTQSIGVLTDRIKALVVVPAATQNP
jgi:hypothetical protein